MEKRDLIDRIFLGICALTLLSVFFPCNELVKVRNGVSVSDYSSILDGKANFVHILLPVAAAFLIILGKRVLASVIGFITVGFNAFTVYYFWDASEYIVTSFHNGGLLAGLARYAGYEDYINVNPFGFYLAIVAMSLLLLISIVNLIIRE